MAQDSAAAYDRRFYVSPMFEYVFHPDDRRGVENGWPFNIGKRINRSFEVELSGQYSQFDSNTVGFTPRLHQWSVSAAS